MWKEFQKIKHNHEIKNTQIKGTLASRYTKSIDWISNFHTLFSVRGTNNCANEILARKA